MNPSLLDTDILSEVLKRRHPIVIQQARTYLNQFGAYAFSAMTRYEVRRGYLRRNAAARLQRFENFCQHSVVYPIDDEVLDYTAELWATARRGGLPDNDADLIIAATAIVHGCTLVTGNRAHFDWIPGLVVGDWRMTAP